MQDKNIYVSPFSTRYASKEMQYVFSEEFKFKTWRRLWIELAKAEKALGLDITDSQIAELEAHAEDINYDVAQAREREVRHDVMSHVYAYGVQCPKAKGIIPQKFPNVSGKPSPNGFIKTILNKIFDYRYAFHFHLVKCIFL